MPPKSEVAGASLELSLFYLKHIYLLSLLLLGRDRGRGCKRQWRRLTEKLGDLLLDCLELELDSGVELRRSKAVSQMFQMLEAARSDEGQRHFRFFLRGVIPSRGHLSSSPRGGEFVFRHHHYINYFIFYYSHSQGIEDAYLGSSHGCSYLLPKQAAGTPKIFIFKTL